VSRFRRIQLTDPQQGEIKLLVAVPRDGDVWGVLSPLRDTPWGEQIQVVSGENLSHALHGWATPLMREIGNPPETRAKRIPDEVGVCAIREVCLGATDACRPGPELPGCYELDTVDPIAVEVAQAWQDGRYVVVVEGSEFSF